MPASEDEAKDVEVLRGPNIKPFPNSNPVTDSISANLTLKVGDNITTDHIMPAGAKILPYRSNIPYLSKFCFEVCDETFSKRAIEAGSTIIVGGSNYGQGSSREHAALVPLYLGVRAVIAKSFARIHRANLINAGILPLEFADETDYNNIDLGDNLYIENIRDQIAAGNGITIINKTKNVEINTKCALTERQKDIILAGGLLNYTMMNK